jgi:hypothetical protein
VPSKPPYLPDAVSIEHIGVLQKSANPVLCPGASHTHEVAD